MPRRRKALGKYSGTDADIDYKEKDFEKQRKLDKKKETTQIK